MSIPNQYGTGPTLDSIFPPYPANATAGYYGGLKKGIEVAQAITPSAANVAEWFGDGGYVKMFERNYLPTETDGEVDDFNVGYNNALQLAGVWEWDQDPDSGHNKVLS